LTPLLIDIKQLAALLSRGVSTLHRDAAAGRLPVGLWIGGSKRWRYEEILAWVAADCPDRKSWEAMLAAAAQRR
jgi:predicted DNA-binding transcriptional regulator AlpA